MSWHVVSAVYRAKLGSATRKGIAAKLADWADDDGCRVYPSVQRVAEETENSVRTVQYTLAAFVKEGLLHKVRAGGKGPRSTTEYRFDLVALAALPRSRSKGAAVAPLADTEGCSQQHLRVQLATSKGAPGAPDSSRETPEEPERGPALSAANDSGIDKHRLSADWTLPLDLRQWTSENFSATEANIDKSARVFRELHRERNTCKTHSQWTVQWRIWCDREKLFAPRGKEAPKADVRRAIEINALKNWCQGIPWDARVGSVPSSRPAALARIAELELQDGSPNLEKAA